MIIRSADKILNDTIIYYRLKIKTDRNGFISILRTDYIEPYNHDYKKYRTYKANNLIIEERIREVPGG